MCSEVMAPGLRWDEKLRKYIGLAYKYAEVREYFSGSRISIEDKVLDPLPFPQIHDSVELRDYQAKALELWMKERRGVIVLPTGAGKTVVALKAIAKLGVATLILVPTIDLMNQWHSQVMTRLGVDAGRLGGGYDSVKGITVSTYDSAYVRAEELGNRFALLIFDEVHHLPSEGYMNVAQMSAAPYRLGLTATPEREDGRHVLLDDLVGPVVFRTSPSQLSGKYLSEFETEKIYVNLTPEEEKRYYALREKFKRFLASRKIRLTSSQDFGKLVRMAYRSREAREALLAWHESTEIAVNSRAKVNKLRELLTLHDQEKTIVFTRNVELAYEISSLFLIPVITYRTPKDEREEILRLFREGKYRVVVTSNVLDEGIDVPDASLAIVLGGYGSRRQLVQRLGRILRKKDGKRAKFIEIVAKGTVDYSLSRRRGSASV